MAEPTLARVIAEFAVELDYARLPAEVANSVRQRVLDSLGIAVAAQPLDTSKMIAAYVTTQGGAPQAQAIGVPGRVPAALAALNNGVLVHSLDFDDTHLPSVLHPSATVIPAAIAAAELAHATGPELLTAIAVGLEVCVRLGMAGYDAEAGNSVFFEHGQHATSICGAMGGAVAAAILLGLDADGVQNTLGVTASMASGIIEANRTGGTVKRLHCGWAAHAAITAAELTRLGLTGPPTVLEGRFGFFEAFLHGQYDASRITTGLGSDWSVPGIFFKPYPANHFTHAAIDAAAALRRRGIHPDEIRELVLGVAEPVIRTIGEPLQQKQAPATGYQAQFSGPYAVAAGLLGGGGLGVGLDDFTDELAGDPVRRALMAKVTVVPDERCGQIFPNQFPAVLRARLYDGREYTEEVLVNRGGPGNPLSDEELVLKYRSTAGRELPVEVLDRLQSAILGLHELTDVQDLLAPLAAAAGPSELSLQGGTKS